MHIRSNALRAEIIGCDSCEAEGHAVRAAAPVLAMCRKLVEAGRDPATPLHAYRGDMLCVKVRSIGEGARYTVEDNRQGTPTLHPWRDPKAATSNMWVMKFKPAPGEFRYAVAVREGSELWLTLWVRRSAKGDVYVLIPRNDSDWEPHTSYHRDGTFHAKSFDRKFAANMPKRQPLSSGAFQGAEHMGTYLGHAPKSVGAVCDPTMFSGIMEVPADVLKPRDRYVAVDLVEPGCTPMQLLGDIIQQQEFRDVIPWIVIRVGRQPDLGGS
jgi:hypothetical protein